MTDRLRQFGKQGAFGLLLVAPPFLLMLWLIFWPILGALFDSLQVPVETGTEWSLSRYTTFFADAYSRANLWITIVTTLVSAALLLVVSLPIALYLRFVNSRTAAVVQSLSLFPLFVPSIILAFAFVRVLGPNGMVDIILNAVGLPTIRSPYLTFWGPVIGFVWDNLPLTLVIILAGLANVSNQSIEAARDVGAGRIAVLRHIILPRISTSILAAMAFVIISIFPSFTFPYLLGPSAPEMMGPFMQRTFNNLYDPETAKVQSVITFICCIGFGAFYVWSILKGRKAAERAK